MSFCLRQMLKNYLMINAVVYKLMTTENGGNMNNTEKNEKAKLKIEKVWTGVLIVYSAVVILATVACGVAFAATNPIAVVNNLSNFIFSLIRAIGMILLGLGIMQVGLSLKSHDPSQRANGFLTLAGGIIITFTKEILTLITG